MPRRYPTPDPTRPPPPGGVRGWIAAVDGVGAPDGCGFPGGNGPPPGRCRGAAVGAGAHAGVHDHRAVGEAFRRNTSGRDREGDRHGERPGAGVGAGAAAGPVVGGGHDRWGYHRCGGVRPRQAGRGLQLSGATRLPAAYRVLGRGRCEPGGGSDEGRRGSPPGSRATVGSGDRATPAGGGEDPVSLGRRVFRRGPGQTLHRQGRGVRDRGETQQRRGPRLPGGADGRVAPGEGHAAHRGRGHRLPARDVAARRRRGVYRAADPDPGRVDAHRSAGPETADHRQGATGPGVGRQARLCVRYSFILTNLDVSTPAKLVEVEHCYRHRTDIEALNKDAKHGAALRHLPSGDRTVNTVWMWAALLACAISNWIQEITGIDDGRGRARRTLARIRREVINIPARLTRSARRFVLRPPPGTRARLLEHVLTTLQALPTIRAG